jgi:hypothetical protein
MHQFILLLTRESEISLDAKKTQAANSNNAGVSELFAILIHCSCSAGCPVSGSRENAHFMAYKKIEQSAE